jgi:proline dehydrogenase
MLLFETLRPEFPELGITVLAALPRAVEDCRRLADSDARVRLCKGRKQVAKAEKLLCGRAVDRSYVRCLKTLFAGSCYPMVATHDGRMIRIAAVLAANSGRGAADFEYQMLYGVREPEQRRLADIGQRCRVYVPYGEDWYAFFRARITQHPATFALLLRSVVADG